MQRLLEVVILMALLLLAWWLRSKQLAHFVTADEHNWVYRSGLFFNALLTGNWAGTAVWLTPGVTTTWLGTAGLGLFYAQNQADIGRPLADWLLTFSRNKIDLNILLALRTAMAIYTTLMLGVIYGLARKLWRFEIALLGTILLAVAPYFLAVNRIIGHDAPVTFFMLGAVLAFMVGLQALARNHRPVGWVLLSAVMTGLALLSKSTALFLLPFIALMMGLYYWRYRLRRQSSVGLLLLWGIATGLTFTLFWPAVWVAPVRQIWDFVQNALLSSGGLDADLQPYGSIPDLGPWFYVVNGLYRISPIVLLGVVLALFYGWRVKKARSLSWLSIATHPLTQLLMFALLFGVMMTLGVKQSARYSLPSLAALTFVAAWGWLTALKRLPGWGAVILIALPALLLTSVYRPYYFTYFNPLLGGGTVAQRVVRIGWGQGLDEVARWLNEQPDAFADRLGVKYTATIFPFYSGDVASPVKEGLDYVAFYIKQSQSGYPEPEILRYFEAQGALHQVTLNGVDYAQIYKGPAMELVEAAGDNLPLAYRPHTIYAPIGERLTVDVLWPADKPAGEIVELQFGAPSHTINAEAEVFELRPGVRISRHHIDIPVNLPRDTYGLRFNGHEIGVLNARQMTPAESMTPLSTNLHHQLKLAGMNAIEQDDQLTIHLAWQAWPQATNDYTVFVQLLNEADERVAGVDVRPVRDFTSLDHKEMMISEYTLPIVDVPPGDYNLLIGLYYFAGDELINVGQTVLTQAVTLAN